MTLEDIAEQLRSGSPGPAQLSNFLLNISGEYAYTASKLEQILMIKPAAWLALREESKSDAQADKKWEASENGLQESIYKLKLKSMEKQMSAIKSRLHIAEMEARNQF